MALDLTYVNAALTRTGNGKITQFDDGSPAGDIAGANYEQLVLAEMSGYPWRWATKTVTLTALDVDATDPWLYTYQLPGDLKHLMAVSVSGLPIDYEVQGTRLLCDVDTTADVVAKHVWNVPEGSWPGEFGEYITLKLEAIFLRGINHLYQEAADRDKAALRKLAECKTIDSKRRTARNPVSSPTLAARGAVSSSGTLLTARTG
jgi:hypothetical protein